MRKTIINIFIRIIKYLLKIESPTMHLRYQTGEGIDPEDLKAYREKQNKKLTKRKLKNANG